MHKMFIYIDKHENGDKPLDFWYSLFSGTPIMWKIDGTFPWE